MFVRYVDEIIQAVLCLQYLFKCALSSFNSSIKTKRKEKQFTFKACGLGKMKNSPLPLTTLPKLFLILFVRLLLAVCFFSLGSYPTDNFIFV